MYSPYFRLPLDEWTGGTMYQEAIEYLRSRGFMLNSDFSWTVPFGFQFERRDLDAVQYLSDEHDFKAVIFIAGNPTLH